MHYHKDDLRDIERRYAALQSQYATLLLKYVGLDLKSPRAKEFSLHGFCRRLNIMKRCIVNVFTALPPSQEGLPTDDNILDATISMQSFLFNTFGSMDNLAWIYVEEACLLKGDAFRVHRSKVGLGPNNIEVRSMVSKEFQTYLASLDKWFSHIYDVRHALAHRIPVYVPPYVVEAQNLNAYQELEAQKSKALEGADLEEHNRLSIQQRRLAHFRPWAQHSYEESARPFVFHPQMLADFLTVYEVAHQMLAELEQLRA